MSARGIPISVFLAGLMSLGAMAWTANGTRPGPSLIIEPGTRWIRSHPMFLFFTLRSAPQFASWIETEGGDFVCTVAVTKSAVKGAWISAPKEGRPESLPVWFCRSSAKKEGPGLDAVTQASPKSPLEVPLPAGAALKPGERYRVFLEINHSFDYNDAWPKEAAKGSPNYSGVNGQPSVVYSAAFTAAEYPLDLTLEPLGTGSVDGSHGLITPGLAGLDTALEIIKSARLAF